MSNAPAPHRLFLDTDDIADALRRLDAIRGENATRERALDALESELVVLETFDEQRLRAGHDYGSGQRGAELSRRRGRLQDGDRDGYPTYTTLLERDLGTADLAAAWRRIAPPRVRRLHRELAQASTPGRRAGIRAWDRTARLLDLEPLA